MPSPQPVEYLTSQTKINVYRRLYLINSIAFRIQEKKFKTRGETYEHVFEESLISEKRLSDQTIYKRRKYVYFDQLLFLLPTMEGRPTVNKFAPTQEGNSESEDKSSTVQTVHQSQDDTMLKHRRVLLAPKLKKQAISARNKQAKKKPASYEESSLNILKEKKKEVIDDDKSFLFSLVPSFKILKDAQKLDAKMEFLST